MTKEQARRQLLQWFGVFGAPFAWTVQHIAGVAVTLAGCGRIGHASPVAINTLTIVVSIPAALIAVAAGAAAVTLYRATREAAHDGPPPSGREHFLAIVGMSITPLFLAIILMTGSGVIDASACRQS